jgi:CVNH domain
MVMRCISTLSLVAITIVLGQAGRSIAAQETNPPGSYQQTCSDISVKKGNLYAKCQDEKGKAHSTKLSSYEKCGSDIVNKNGHLECARAEGGTPSQPSGPLSQPSGSYTESCKDIRMKGSTLHAICKSLDGREMPTSLRDANRCSQGVVNINGILNCQVNDVLPPGSYISTCKDVRMHGTTLYASCNNGKDRWLAAQLRDANKCSGDIANQNGTLRCTPFKRMEKR